MAKSIVHRLREPGFYIEGAEDDQLVYYWLDHWGWVAAAVLLIGASIATAYYILYLFRIGQQGIFDMIQAVVVVGLEIVAAYALLRRFLNRTMISKKGGKIIVIRGPFPWYRRIEVRGEDIVEVGIEEKNVSNMRGRPWDVRRRVYSILLKRESQGSVWLVKGMSSFAAALKAKKAVAEYLTM